MQFAQLNAWSTDSLLRLQSFNPAPKDLRSRIHRLAQPMPYGLAGKTLTVSMSGGVLSAYSFETYNDQPICVMPKTNTLNDLLIEELKDLYSAETQLTKALPKLAKAASNEELKAGFEEHLEQTKVHVSRLERIFELLGASPKGKKCAAMEGLIQEGSEKIELEADPAIKDAALIGAAQKVEHYEIAGYGTVRTWAEVLGEDEVASILEETLDEESETDEKLTELSETINEEADQPNS